MSNRALAPVNQPEVTLTVLNGDDKGAVYRIQGSKVMMGRGSDNDVVIVNDPKVSRVHARISMTPQGVIISNMSDRNTLKVNGQEHKTTMLPDNCTIELGNTQFRFQIQMPTAPSNVPAIPQSGPPALGLVYPTGENLPPPGPHPTAQKPKMPGAKKSPFFYVLIAVILAMGWLLLSPSKKNEKPNLPRSDEQIEAEINLLEENSKKRADERQKAGFDTQEYRLAQSFYVRGFRDYNVGQYERALESFQACLSLFPAHTMCQRYQRLSQKKFSELVQYHMILGRKYKDQGQYKACVSSYRNVMTMIKDTSNTTYKEARLNFMACSSLIEERY